MMYPLRGFDGQADYPARLALRFGDVVNDMIRTGDWRALGRFGNYINALARRRGLAYDEPITIITAATVERLKPSDFEGTVFNA